MRRPINDNEGNGYGADPFGDTFEKWRIADAAKQIEADLNEHLQFGHKHLGRICRKGEAYSKGLTNGEIILAVITALSSVQRTFVDKLAGMNFGPDDDDVGDEDAA